MRRSIRAGRNAIHSYALFALAFLVSVATPGPDVLAVIARALASRRGTQCAGMILGILAGKLVMLGGALAGLVALARLLGPVFIAIKLAGGFYLIFLGIRLWRRELPDGLVEPSPRTPARDFAIGLAMALGNPIAILFYAALLPNTVDVARADLWMFLVLAGIVAAATTTVYAVYAGLAARIGAVFRGKSARRRLDRMSAAVMVGAGVAITVR